MVFISVNFRLVIGIWKEYIIFFFLSKIVIRMFFLKGRIKIYFFKYLMIEV